MCCELPYVCKREMIILHYNFTCVIYRTESNRDVDVLFTKFLMTILIALLKDVNNTVAPSFLL